MPVPTQSEIAQQMIDQLRILDPSVSAALGTPERKIIDTVAQALADAQLDLSVLAGSLDLDTKFGADLDRFLSVFNFARQRGTTASGVVTFSRSEASTLDIRIPLGTQVAAATGDAEGLNVIFQTTSDVVLVAGTTEISAPIRANQVGSLYNVPANSITAFVGTPVFGITGVTNTVSTLGGLSAETDAELKVRFKNTLFRNLAGTTDQFLALSVAGAFTNKANVIGPISRYREYMQIPPVADNDSYDTDGNGSLTSGNGSAGQYTTALSTIPYSEHVYTTVPSFVSSGQDAVATFFTEGLDFVVNTSDADRNKGDAYRLATTGQEVAVASSPNRPNVTFLNTYTGSDDDVEGARPEDVVLFEHSYTSSASRNDFANSVTNCVDVYINGSNAAPAITVIPRPEVGVNLFVNNTTSRFHFANYRRLGEPDARPLLGNIFTPLFWNPLESLPDELNIDNYTYYNGTHYWPVIDVSDTGGTIRARTGIEWSADAKGQDSDDEGEFYTGPRITASDVTSIEIPNYTYDKNVLDLQSALEASKQVTTDVLVHKATKRYFKFNVNVMYSAGSSSATVNAAIRTALDAWLNSLYFGNTIQLSDVLQIIHNVQGVDNVRWSNDVDATLDCVIETTGTGKPRLNAVVDRVVTGSSAPNVIEVHQWYFTGTPTAGTFVVTHDGASTSAIPYNASAATIQTAVRTAFANSLLTVTGTGVSTDPFILTWALTSETQLVTLTGATGGTFTLTFDGQTTGTIAYNAAAATVETALEALSNLAPADVAVSGSAGGPYTVVFAGAYADLNVSTLVANGTLLTGTTPTVAVTTPVPGQQYGPRNLIEVVPEFSGQYTYNEDFTLYDNELPALPTAAVEGDTVAGLIVRPRAQSTWKRG